VDCSRMEGVSQGGEKGRRVLGPGPGPV
jgi:hypothetical protein